MSQTKIAVSSLVGQEKSKKHIVRHTGLLFLAFLLLIAISLVLSLHLLDSITTLRTAQDSPELHEALILGHILVACFSLLLCLRVGKSLLNRSQQRDQAEHTIKQMTEDLETRIRERTEDLLGYIQNTELIFSSTLDGIIEVDSSGVILFINKAGMEISGYAEGDWLIHAFQDSSDVQQNESPTVFEDKHGPSCDCPLCSLNKTNENSRFSEIPLRCKHGEIVYVDGSIAPVIQDGKPNGAIFVFHNISEYSKMESLQQAIFESSIEPFLIFSPRRLSSCNSAAIKFFGVKSSEELCWNFQHFSTPFQNGIPSEQSIAEKFDDCDQHGTSRFSWVHCHADGTQIPCSVSLSKMTHPLYKGYLASITDLRIVKRYEAKLQEDRDLLNTIINASPMPMYIENQEGVVTVINPMAEHLLPLHLGSQSAEVWVNRQDLNTLQEQVVSTGAYVCGRDARLYSRNSDACLETRTSISKLVYEGESASLFWVQDISDIVAAKEQAEKYSQSKGEFLARMSHEIRTPMNAILGMTYLFAQNPLEDWQKRYIFKIQDAAKGLLGIINDILDFSKIEAGKMSLEIAPFTLSELVEGVSNVCSPLAEDKKLELLFHIYSDMPDIYEGDMLRLSQILINLLSNAVKFTDSGEVVLRIREKEHYPDSSLMELEVYDTGIGMDEEQLSRLFLSFEQADSSTTRRFGGTGLGLFICKQLVQMMHGKISARSKPGVGTIFNVQVLLQSSFSENSVKRKDFTCNERVLVVDDNEAARTIISDMIAGFGFQVASAASGQEACGALFWAANNGAPYTLVLLDWKMPGMDGFECAKLISELPLNTPPKLIMVSACGLEEYTARGEKFGFVDYISKPVTPSALFNALAKVMGMEHLASLHRKSRQGEQAKNISTIRGAHILLVEDNETNREVASTLLQRLGMEVEQATSGLEAVTLCKNRHYDLVFMDIQMPIMDGLEATRRIRADGDAPQLPIIAMTAHAMHSDRNKSLEAGMNDHITKPINPDMLCTTLLKWIPARNGPDTGDAGDSGKNEEIPPVLPIPTEKCPFTLQDVDLAGALYNVGGDLKSLTEHLQRFPTRYGHYAKLLREHIAANLWEDASRTAHTLKGVSATLGMTALTQCAAELEKHCGNRAVSEENLEEFGVLLARISSDIHSTLPQHPDLPPLAAPAAPNPLATENLCKLLTILPHMLAGDVGKCMITLNDIKNYVPDTLRPDVYQKLYEAVYEFNTVLVDDMVKTIVAEFESSR